MNDEPFELNEESFGFYDENSEEIKAAGTTGFSTLDHFFRWKPRDLNTWMCNAGYGSTTTLLNLMLTKSINDGWKWALFMPHSNVLAPYTILAEMYLGERVTADNSAAFIEAADFLSKHFFVIDPSFAYIEQIHATLTALMTTQPLNGILIDKISDLVAIDVSGTTTEAIFYRKLYTQMCAYAYDFKLSYNVIMNSKSFLREGNEGMSVVSDPSDHNERTVVNMTSNLLSIHRTSYYPESPDFSIHIEKIKRMRSGGNCGVASPFTYSKEKCRIAEYPCNPKLKTRNAKK